jgi:hypothetical protein
MTHNGAAPPLAHRFFVGKEIYFIGRAYALPAVPAVYDVWADIKGFCAADHSSGMSTMAGKMCRNEA